MSLPYDPTSADIRADATISTVARIVTNFARSDSTVKTTFQNSNGSFRGRHLVQGEETATMTIEIKDSSEVLPGPGVTFSYDGSTWAIKSVSKTKGGGGTAGSYTLELGWVSTP
jgi:hypothetical protein